MTKENGQRHAAVRPDVFAGKQKPRTWVWTHPKVDEDMCWVAELREGWYLRCLRSGKLEAYPCTISPAQGSYGTFWRELA